MKKNSGFLMDKDFLKEQLNCLRNEMTHLWGSTFLFGGSSLMLLLRGVSPLEYIIGIIGLVAAIVFFKAYIIKRNKTVRIVNKLKEINNEL